MAVHSVSRSNAAQLRSQYEADRSGGNFYLYKRGLDALVAAALIVLLLPLALVIAILIKFDSVGPVFFVQDRIGSRWNRRAGKCEVGIFRIIKFRSMVRDADPKTHEDRIRAFVAGADLPDGDPSSSSPKYKPSSDARVTRVGRILRRTSLDELPQLINVLKGDLSLVGPRAVPLYEAAQYQMPHLRRFEAPSGLTGLWQIAGRCDLDFEQMMAMDSEYVERQSFLLDLKIMILTVPAVLSGRGAA